MGVLDAIAVDIDKKREVSIQEGSYRLLGLPMVKSSVLVKFVNTNHPSKRDGLLKGNILELEDGESPFHSNIIDYYQCRPFDDKMNSGDFLERFDIHSWEDMCLADFVSCFDIVVAALFPIIFCSTNTSLNVLCTDSSFSFSKTFL